ncbi:MAG: hypothetical protein HRT38_19240 [Alteromonadaceae bacterium]|nr:hypothetical protein [Alteromonadaceae bacterium]
MYTNNDISPERKKRAYTFIKGVIVFQVLFGLLFLLTFKLPIIPNDWLVDNLGKISCSILSTILFYYLLFCRGTRGKIILIESLKYHCNSLGQRIIVCGGIIGFCGIFYLLGRLFVPVITSPALFIPGEHQTIQARLINADRGQGWYRGHTKLTLALDKMKISFYWPTSEVKQLIQGNNLNITTNKIWLGTHIMEIKKVD